MGNDGGSIPDRRDLVRNKPKAEQADKANQTRARWLFCALSKKRLQEPVVSCALGKLYNKDAIIEYLLDKSAYGDGEKICGHIRSLKDVKTLTLTPNNASSSTDSKADSTDRPQFACPLTMKEMNGVQPFVYISTCGCVFSQAGLKTVASSSSPKEKASDSDEGGKSLSLCPQCAKKYSASEDVIVINSPPEEEETLRFALDRKRLLEPAKKKSKKRKNQSPEDGEEPPTKKQAAPVAVPSLNPSIAAASRAVVSGLAMEEAKRKAGMSDAVKSLYGDGTKRKETFMTMGTFTRYA
ncbi:Rtf2 RING-finger-domain-containing protein [Crassisporium funariophilum]|nr:Rtf2 RING-finger-domain-containing protein [Crassisporium funariophilum]